MVSEPVAPGGSGGGTGGARPEPVLVAPAAAAPGPAAPLGPGPAAPVEPSSAPHLERRIGLASAVSLNMMYMIGVGPFITLPLIVAAMGGVAGAAGLVAGRADRGLRRAGVGRAGRGDAGSRRIVRVSAGDLRP